MNIRASLLGAALIGVLAAPARPQEPEPTGREVMERYKRQDRTDDQSSRLGMALVNSRGGRRERTLTYVTKTDAEGRRKTLIRFLSPADIEGTGFLEIEHDDRDDDRWLYLPSLRKTRRIAGADKTDDFVGSEFTYEDLESEKLDLHGYRLVGSEEIDGRDAWVVEAVATDPKKAEETGYSKRKLWIGKDHHLILRTDYYDRDGSYVKRFTAGDLRQVAGTEKWRAYRMQMEDVRSGDRTVLETSELVIDQGMPDDFFSERYLKRGR